MFPLPLQPVRYTEFEHIVHHPVQRSDSMPARGHGDADWRRWTIDLPEHLNDVGIASCHTVVVPDGHATARGVVFSRDGSLIVGASLPARNNVDDYYVPTRFFPPTYRGDSVAVLTSSLQDNYYHWLMEILPRIHLLHAKCPRVDSLYVRRDSRFQEETLSLLGLERNTCVSPTRYEMVQASCLVVPFHEIKPCMRHPVWVSDFLRDRFLPLADRVPSSSGRRLYITREDSAWRHVLNEDEVVAALAPLGFHRVALGQRPFLEQVALFRDADVIVAPHGAALANLVFGRPGSRVVEFQPRKVQDAFFRLSESTGLEYYYVKSTTGPTNPSNNKQQLTIDVDELLDTVRAAGVVARRGD